MVHKYSYWRYSGSETVGMVEILYNKYHHKHFQQHCGTFSAMYVEMSSMKLRLHRRRLVTRSLTQEKTFKLSTLRKTEKEGEKLRVKEEHPPSSNSRACWIIRKQLKLTFFTSGVMMVCRHRPNWKKQKHGEKHRSRA